MSLTTDPRCAFTYKDGRRCRMLRSRDHATLCVDHARRELKENGELPTPPPPIFPGDRLDSPRSVRRALKRVVHAAAVARITPQLANALANLLRLTAVTATQLRSERLARRSTHASRS